MGSEYSIATDLILFGIALVFCAVFAFLETSITALRLFRLREIAQSTGKYKKLFTLLEEKPGRVLTTVLVANNLANVTAATLSGRAMEALSHSLHLSERLGVIIGIAVATTSILIVELIPKNYAKAHGERLFTSTLWLANVTYFFLSPFVYLLNKLTDGINNLLVGDQHVEEALTSEKEIQFLIDYINQKGLMERHKIAMLKSIFELGTTAVKEIMIPETEVISMSVETPLNEVLSLFSKYQFSRIPVYEGSPDNIIGLLHQKDFFLLFSKHQDSPLKDYIRPIMFFPESAKALRTLREFREQRMHMAMVLNEFGSITGLVTLEDVIEEIVGEISDEYEAVTQKIVPLASGGWLVDATTELEELAGVLAIEFETDDALTLGGFLIEQLQHVPRKGEHVIYKNFYFQVQQASPKRIMQVLIYQEKANASL